MLRLSRLGQLQRRSGRHATVQRSRWANPAAPKSQSSYLALGTARPCPARAGFWPNGVPCGVVSGPHPPSPRDVRVVHPFALGEPPAARPARSTIAGPGAVAGAGIVSIVVREIARHDRQDDPDTTPRPISRPPTPPPPHTASGAKAARRRPAAACRRRDQSP